MARRRFFVDQVRNGHAQILGDEAHHLTRVLRVEAGQKYEISDTRRVWLAEVATARKNLVEFSVIEEIAPGPELPEVNLYLALIKFERFEWAVEKATELGVTRIVPVEAARSERGLYEGAQKRIERWRRVARESSEQSRRVRPPEIGDAIRFEAALSVSSTHRIWLDEQPGARLLVNALALNRGDSVSLLIGPEGGWTDAERGQFALAAWTGASLGPFVLRTETAVCAALAVISQLSAATMVKA
ncbi:MAG: RsmE family RNA methyltransferase [Bryobacteraceae bacterium]|jgi:16S rRNA (uracil1498-N3)-methyltransferase